MRSFFARAPAARANCRSLFGLIRRTDKPAANKARTTPRSGDTKSSPAGSDRYVQTIDRNIDPDIVRFAHLRTPSLLMRARALATVRVWKIWLERQAHPRSNSQDAHGLPAMAGAGS